MRKSSEILRRTLALGLIGALAFSALNCHAREPARVIQKPPAARMPLGSWSKASGLDVTWNAVGRSAGHRWSDITLKRGVTRDAKPQAVRTRSAVAMETVEVAHEGFTSPGNTVPMETVTIVSERIQRVSAATTN